MKLAFSTLGCPEFGWSDVYSMAKDLGFQGIEVRGLGDELFDGKTKPFQQENLQNLGSAEKNPHEHILHFFRRLPEIPGKGGGNPPGTAALHRRCLPAGGSLCPYSGRFEPRSRWRGRRRGRFKGIKSPDPLCGGEGRHPAGGNQRRICRHLPSRQPFKPD